MQRQRKRDSIWTIVPPQTTALLIAISLLASYGIADGADDVESQKAYLRSLVPQVAKPSPTAEQSERGFLSYWAQPTTNFYSNIPPTAQDLRRQATIRTFPGEDEPLLLGVWGLRDMNLASVWLTKPVFEMTVRVPSMSVVGGNQLPFSMGKLGVPHWLGPDTVQKVRSDHNAFFWINIYVPPGTKPGRYDGEITLNVSDNLGKYLSRPGGWSNVKWKNQFGYTQVKLPFTVEVLPLTVPHADIAFGMYFRGLGNRMFPPDYLTEEMMMGYYRDMARHGQTSIYHVVAERLHRRDGSLMIPGVARNHEDTPGSAYAELPTLSNSKRMDMMFEAGLIHREIPIMWEYSGGLGSFNDRAAASTFAKNLKAECKRRGWPEPLWYGPDEPDAEGPRVEAFRFAFDTYQPYRAGGVRLLTAISPECVEAYADDLDVWVVYNRTPKDSDVMNEIFPELQRLAVQHDAEVWTYVCTWYGTNPKYHRYYAGLFTWAHKLKGNFLWCYGEYHTWEGDRTGDNYVYVLPSKDGPVPSVAWEARREGIEDFRIIRRIEKLCEQKKGLAAEQARKWVSELRKRVVSAKTKGCPSFPGFSKRHIQDIGPQFGRGELAEIRNRAIDLLIGLERGTNRR